VIGLPEQEAAVDLAAGNDGAGGDPHESN